MRSLTGVLSAFAAIAILMTLGPVERARGQGKQKGKAAATPRESVPHDPHDLTGVWRREGGVLTMSAKTPAMTPWAKAKFDANKPVYGPRAVQGGFGNDPMSNCDPNGMPRSIFLEVSIYPYELAQLPNRVVQFFEWQHSYRTIWTDGRELPKDPDPQWMGYSVGKWEGDTFVVKSLGFDERAWLDHFGDPVSDDMVLEERYKRVDRDTLEVNMTITAPKAYTEPWISEKKTLRLVPKGELQELFCVPSEEQRFNSLVRDPGSGIVKK